MRSSLQQDAADIYADCKDSPMFNHFVKSLIGIEALCKSMQEQFGMTEKESVSAVAASAETFRGMFRDGVTKEQMALNHEISKLIDADYAARAKAAVNDVARGAQ